MVKDKFWATFVDVKSFQNDIFAEIRKLTSVQPNSFLCDKTLFTALNTQMLKFFLLLRVYAKRLDFIVCYLVLAKVSPNGVFRFKVFPLLRVRC